MYLLSKKTSKHPGYLFRVLVQLQGKHGKACKTKAAEITMDRNEFARLAINVQKAWEYIQEAKTAREEAKGGFEESLILKSLNHLQASIAGLEQKYKDAQAKVTENNREIARKLNEGIRPRSRTITKPLNAQLQRHRKRTQTSSRPQPPTQRKRPLQKCAPDKVSIAKNERNMKSH